MGLIELKTDSSERDFQMDKQSMLTFKNSIESKPLNNELDLVFYSHFSRRKVFTNEAANKISEKYAL